MGAKYRPELDGLRAIAVLAVVLFHSRIPGFEGGARGVDMFFVLSGYLITTILKAEAERGAPDVAAFWLRRFARLTPALLTMLVAYVLLAPVVFPGGYSATRWIEAVCAALYVYDYSILWTGPGTPLTHMWSLAVEAQFYALWPFIVPRLMRLRDPMKVLLLAWAAFTFLRVGTLVVTADGPAAYFPLHARATGLILGAALTFAPPMPRLGWLALAAILALFVTQGANPYAGVIWRVSAVEVATALLIADLARPSKLRAALSWDPLRRIGVVSYALYLWHLPVWMALDGLSPYPKAALACAISVALAGISFVTVERWGRRLLAPKAAPAAVPV